MEGNRIGKANSRRGGSSEDRQKIVRKHKDYVQSTLFSDGSDDRTVRSDDTFRGTVRGENSVDKPDSRPSDGSGDSDGAYSVETIRTEEEVFDLARQNFDSEAPGEAEDPPIEED
jgi:hypothetical protein